MSAVDVIVPCYRYGHFLRQCVESVLTQSGPSVRVLIIDDASPDNTSEVASELAREDCRVTFRKHTTNKGHISTYNEGIEWVAADYMLLLSADDYLLPNAFRRATDLMDKHPEMAFTFGNAIRLDPHATRTIRSVKVSGDFRILKGLDFIRISGASNVVPSPTAVTRTCFQKRVGGYRPELPHSGDMEMWLRLAANGSVGVINSCQAVYRRHSSNMSLEYMANSFFPEILQRKTALDLFFTDCGHLLPHPKSLEKKFQLSLARIAVGLASSALADGQNAVAEKLSGFAVSMCPAVRFSPSWAKFLWTREVKCRATSLRRKFVKASDSRSIVDNS